MKKLSSSFYLNEDVCDAAIKLLGKVLYTNFDGQKCSGIIVETEAYAGYNDKACHANNGKRSPRTEIFYSAGGVSYVYICYGIHHLFNVITNKKNRADAVLIRVLEPIDGIETMLLRRNKLKIDNSLTKGPGSLALAMGISKKHNGISLQGNEIWIEDHHIKYSQKDIIRTARIGCENSGADGLRPWRYYVKNNAFVSGNRLQNLY